MTSQINSRIPRVAMVATLGVAIMVAEAQAAGLGSRGVFGGRTYVNNSISDPNYGATSQTQVEGWQWQNLGTGHDDSDAAAQSGTVTTTTTPQQTFARQQQTTAARRFGLGWQYQERLFGNTPTTGAGRPVVTRPTQNNSGTAFRQPRYLTVRPSNWPVVNPGNGGSVGNNHNNNGNNNGNGSQAQLTAQQRYEIQWMRRLIDRQTTAAAMSTLAASRTTDAELAAMYTQMATEQAEQVDQLQNWLNQWYDVNYDPGLSTSAERQIARYESLSDTSFQSNYARWLVLQQSALDREVRQINNRAAHSELNDWAGGLVEADDNSNGN